jgi:predicted acyltransferase (DUF342 family)
VGGGLSTVNGGINLTGTAIKKNVSTNNGDITLKNKSIVEGDIIIKESHSFTDRLRTLDIRISDGSSVKGDIIVKEEDMKVKVYLSQGGNVEGQVKGAEVTRE